MADDDEERKHLLSCNSALGLYPKGCRMHKHDEQVPAALEAVVERLGDLEVVIGAHAAPVVTAVRSLLITAMAARDRGDLPEVVARIGAAMDKLSALADGLDPAEAMLMRALAQNFRAALLRGDAARAKQDAAVMFEKSGAVPRKKE